MIDTDHKQIGIESINLSLPDKKNEDYGSVLCSQSPSAGTLVRSLLAYQACISWLRNIFPCFTLFTSSVNNFNFIIYSDFTYDW